MVKVKKGERTPIDLKTKFRVVSMKQEGKSSTDIAYILNTEAGAKVISPQRVSQIYATYKDIPFNYEDDKVIIH